MTAVGITGHRTLGDGAQWSWVHGEIKTALDVVEPPLIGVSGLAEGADQCFAEEVLARGGRLHAVLAFDDFRETIESANARATFDAQLARAEEVEVVSPRATPELSYLAAGERVVDLADVMIAVWDGQPAHGVGGTAEIVEYAQSAKRPVLHVDTASMTVQWR
jgi:hypothetical protein